MIYCDGFKIKQEVITMKVKIRRPELLDALLEQQKKVKDIQQWRQIEAIWLREKLGMTGSEVAEALNYKLQTVHMLWHRWLSQGMLLFTEKKGRGGRNHSYMTIDDEGLFLKAFTRRAESGGILAISQIHTAYEERIGKKVSLSTVYRLLYRHGWRKVSPRKRHPKSNPEQQEHIKKPY
jgi:transposase